MTEILEMMKRVGQRIDALALDLARDAGIVARSAREFADASRAEADAVAQDAQAFAEETREEARAVARSAQAFVAQVREQAQTISRATPRVMSLAQAAAAVVARWRWLRLAQAARTGDPSLREEDHRDLARRVAAQAAELSMRRKACQGVSSGGASPPLRRGAIVPRRWRSDWSC